MHVQVRPDGLNDSCMWLEKTTSDGTLQPNFLNMKQSGWTLPCRDGGWS